MPKLGEYIKTKLCEQEKKLFAATAYIDDFSEGDIIKIRSNPFRVIFFRDPKTGQWILKHLVRFEEGWMPSASIINKIQVPKGLAIPFDSPIGLVTYLYFIESLRKEDFEEIACQLKGENR